MQIVLALIVLLPLPPMMRGMPEQVKGGVPYISCRMHTIATPASPSLINPMVCTSHTASDWSLTDEESAGEKSDLDNRGQETWSLTHVYSLHVSALKYGYKGVFVKARAAPAFNQTFGLRLYERSNPDTLQPTQKKCSFTISGPDNFTKERFVFILTDSVIVNVIITIRWAGVEDSVFPLRDLLNFAIQLTGWGLVKAYAVSHITCLYGIQETKRAHTIHISGVLRQIKGDLRKRQRGKKEVYWGKLTGEVTPT